MRKLAWLKYSLGLVLVFGCNSPQVKTADKVEYRDTTIYLQDSQLNALVKYEHFQNDSLKFRTTIKLISKDFKHLSDTVYLEFIGLEMSYMRVGWSSVKHADSISTAQLLFNELTQLGHPSVKKAEIESLIKTVVPK